MPLSPASSGEYTSALTAIQNDLDNPNQYKADVSNLALQATSLAIKGQTDKIPATPAQTGEYNAALTAIQADLDNPNQYKADVSGLATSAELAQTEADIIAAMPDETVIPDGIALEASVQAIKAKTDNLPATPASAGEYTTNIGAIKAKTDNLPTTPAASGEYTSALTAIQADLDNPNQYKADVSGLATSAELSDVEDNIIAAMPDEVVIPDGIAMETSVQAIKAKTDNLPATPASAGEYTAAIAAIPTAPLLAANYTAPDNASIATIKAKTNLIPANPAVADEYDAALAAIQADLDNPNQYKSDVSALMLASSYVAPNNAGITAIKAKTDNLPANTATALAAIQSDLDNPAQYKADVSGLATTAHVQEVGDKVDAIDTDTVMSFMIDGFTFEQIIQIMASVLAGKLTRFGDTLTFRDLADTVNRVIAETDANKQRADMTYSV